MIPPIKLGPSKRLPLCGATVDVGREAVLVRGFAVVFVGGELTVVLELEVETVAGVVGGLEVVELFDCGVVDEVAGVVGLVGEVMVVSLPLPYNHEYKKN